MSGWVGAVVVCALCISARRRGLLTARGDGDELELHAADPAHGGEAVLQEEVVRLVVEAPLADDEVCAAVLALLHHGGEVLLVFCFGGVVWEGGGKGNGA